VILASFWPSFLPNFAATIAAVVGGIPIGLWLNRRAERSVARARVGELREADQRRVTDERARAREALEQLEPVVRSHAPWFRILGAWGNLNEYHEGPLAELWMVLRGQIIPAHLSDRRLFGDLAIHFERCVRLDELVRLRSSLSLAGPPAQQQRVTDDHRAIQTRLNNMIHAEAADPEHIADRTVAEIDRLKLSS
jgi:hypothetical protein